MTVLLQRYYSQRFPSGTSANQIRAANEPMRKQRQNITWETFLRNSKTAGSPTLSKIVVACTDETFYLVFNLRIFVIIYAEKYILLISTNLKPCLNLFEPMRWERKFSNFQHLLLLPFSKDSIQHRLLIGRNENVGWCRREVQLFEQPIAERHFLHLNFDWFISFPHSHWMANKNSRTLHGIETFLRHRITSEKQGGGHKTDDDCSIFVNVELFGLESVDAEIKCCHPMSTICCHSIYLLL